MSPRFARNSHTLALTTAPHRHAAPDPLCSPFLPLRPAPSPAQVVTDFCSQHLERNVAAFADPRLRLINDDARTQLEAAEDASFDVIIGDLADPLDGGPCYQLYTQVGRVGTAGGGKPPGPHWTYWQWGRGSRWGHLGICAGWQRGGVAARPRRRVVRAGGKAVRAAVAWWGAAREWAGAKL